MLNFFKKRKKKVYEKWFIFFIATFTVTCGIVSELFKGTSASTEVPANSAFDDINFYKCVVDAYNSANGTSVAYTTSLTDAQLSDIFNLHCSNKGIKSVKGIEKLTSLFSVSLNSNLLTAIDVSKNTRLSTLNLDNNSITSLNLTNNLDLSNFSVYKNQIKSIDLSKNTKLSSLEISNNQLTELDLSNNLKLYSLEIFGNKITSIDLSKHTELMSSRTFISPNPYGETLYLYKNSAVTLTSQVKLPSHFNRGDPTWTSADENIVIVNDDNTVNAVGAGTVLVEGVIRAFTTTQPDIVTTSTVNVVEITSNIYDIDEENSYIYIGNENNVNVIKSNINLSNDNVSVDVNLNTNKLYVKHADKVLKEFNIVKLSSNTYNLDNEYIYVGNNGLDLNSISVVNCSKNINGNKLEIKYDDILIEDYDIVSISSSKYNLDKLYIYIGANELDLNAISVINGNATVDEYILYIKHENIVLDQYDIVKFGLKNYTILENSIFVTENVSYDDFISNITKSDNVEFKLYNGENVVTSGNIEVGMILKIYYNNKEIDFYVIDDVYVDVIGDLSIINNIIKGVSIGTTVGEIRNNIETNGNISIYHIDDLENVIDDNLRTGDIIKISLFEEVLTYKISVNGDVDGNGIVNMNDIILSSDHIISGNQIIGDEYIKASDFDNDEKTNINDIIKMFRYIKDSGDINE